MKTRLMPSECMDGVNWLCPGSGSGSGSYWSSFFYADCSPFLGCSRCPNMVEFFLVKYFCTRSYDSPGQEVKIFFWLLLPTRIEWGSRMMRCGNTQVWLLICTHTNSPQNIHQEFGTPSLAYYSGSNWAYTDLRVDIVYLSSLFSQSLYWELVLSCHWICPGIHDHKMFQWTARPCWDLEKDVLSVLQLVYLF